MAEFEDTLKKSFQQMIDSVGFGRAVYAFRNELPVEYWERLNHTQWMEIYMAFPNGDKLKEIACEEMRRFLRESKAS